MRPATLLTAAAIVAVLLTGCAPPPKVAGEAARQPGNYGHKTMEDAWLTFLWACQGKDAAHIRECLTGRALKEFETAAKADEAAAVADLFKTFGDTEIVINLDHFDPRMANGLKVLERDTGRLIQIGAVRMENVEPNTLKLPHYRISRFDWDR